MLVIVHRAAAEDAATQGLLLFSLPEAGAVHYLAGQQQEGGLEAEDVQAVATRHSASTSSSPKDTPASMKPFFPCNQWLPLLGSQSENGSLVDTFPFLEEGNWSGLILAHHVASLRPFTESYGNQGSAWNAVANRMMEEHDNKDIRIYKVPITGKKAKERFRILIDFIQSTNYKARVERFQQGGMQCELVDLLESLCSDLFSPVVLALQEKGKELTRERRKQTSTSSSGPCIHDAALGSLAVRHAAALLHTNNAVGTADDTVPTPPPNSNSPPTAQAAASTQTVTSLGHCGVIGMEVATLGDKAARLEARRERREARKEERDNKKLEIKKLQIEKEEKVNLERIAMERERTKLEHDKFLWEQEKEKQNMMKRKRKSRLRFDSSEGSDDS